MILKRLQQLLSLLGADVPRLASLAELVMPQTSSASPASRVMEGGRFREAAFGPYAREHGAGLYRRRIVEWQDSREVAFLLRTVPVIFDL